TPVEVIRPGRRRDEGGEAAGDRLHVAHVRKAVPEHVKAVEGGARRGGHARDEADKQYGARGNVPEWAGHGTTLPGATGKCRGGATTPRHARALPRVRQRERPGGPVYRAGGTVQGFPRVRGCGS